MKIELAKTETIHFVGIGGIGMSGLANIMKGLGFKVQGSDLNLNKNVAEPPLQGGFFFSSALSLIIPTWNFLQHLRSPRPVQGGISGWTHGIS